MANPRLSSRHFRINRTSTPKGATGGGYVSNLDSLVKDLADAIVGELDTVRRQAGPGWRQHHLSEAQALKRIDEWDAAQPTPEVQKAAAKMGKGQLARAALEAIKLRKRAMARGDWPNMDTPPEGPYTPAAPPAQPQMPPPPAVPPPAAAAPMPMGLPQPPAGPGMTPPAPPMPGEITGVPV